MQCDAMWSHVMWCWYTWSCYHSISKIVVTKQPITSVLVLPVVMWEAVTQTIVSTAQCLVSRASLSNMNIFHMVTSVTLSGWTYKCSQVCQSQSSDDETSPPHIRSKSGEWHTNVTRVILHIFTPGLRQLAVNLCCRLTSPSDCGGINSNRNQYFQSPAAVATVAPAPEAGGGGGYMYAAPMLSYPQYGGEPAAATATSSSARREDSNNINLKQYKTKSVHHPFSVQSQQQHPVQYQQDSRQNPSQSKKSFFDKKN